MPAFLNPHNKARARSVQLDSSHFKENMCLPHRDSATPPTPGARSSSILLGQENHQAPSVRHYRSMLVVDAPSLGPHKPISYDELYFHPPLTGIPLSATLLQFALLSTGLFSD